MTARTTVTLQCDRTRDEHCHGIVQANISGLHIDSARRMAYARGWRTATTEDGREQDVCPHCAQRYPQVERLTGEEEATP